MHKIDPDHAGRARTDVKAPAGSGADGPPSEVFGALTLKGHMERRYAAPEAARPMPAARLRVYAVSRP